jgi:hypothetical protein
MNRNSNPSIFKSKITSKLKLKQTFFQNKSCRFSNYLQLSCSKFFKFLFEILRKFNLNLISFLYPSLSLVSPPLLCSGWQRSTTTWRGIPASVSRTKARPPTGHDWPPIALAAGDLRHPISRPCPARTRHAAGEARRRALTGPLSRPCPGHTSLGLAAPSPSSPSCAPIKGLHQAPAHARPSTTTTAPLASLLDLGVEPHLLLHLHPSQAPESVSHGLRSPHTAPASLDGRR